MSQGQSFVSKLQGGDVLYFLSLLVFFSSALFAFLLVEQADFGSVISQNYRIIHVGEHL